jgi:hypothetical protein
MESPEVSSEVLMQSLTGQIARLSREVAERDAYIYQLQQELLASNQAKSEMEDQPNQKA